MTDVAETSGRFCATLVDEWVRQGVQHAVVSPGSRSTPLAVALLRHPALQVHVFHDERSASFAALGIGLSTSVPAVLLCTSGTAATHFHGAVAEAHQSNVPMIVCTADRPPELRDVGAPQTIDQTNLYGHAVRWFHDPGVPAAEASGSWRSLAVRAFTSSKGLRPGPVHLNLPFREPLLGAHGGELPARDTVWSSTQSELAVPQRVTSQLAGILSGVRGVVIAGRGATPGVLVLAKKLGWPVFAEPRSGLRVADSQVVSAFDPILRNAKFAQENRPSVFLRVGEPVASKVTNQWIAASGATIVQVQEHEMVLDPDHLVHLSVTSPVDGLMAELLEKIVGCDAQWMSSWERAEISAQKAIGDWTSDHHSEPTASRVLSESVEAGDNIVLSSSMPVRDFEWFGAPLGEVRVFSNRGANGIDGVVSTAVGIALATSRRTHLLIGDVAMVHDSNGLWGIASRNVNMNIVVNNNDGGSIFSFLPQASLLDAESFEVLYGTPHGVDFAQLAGAHGVRHIRLDDARNIASALPKSGVNLIEIVFDRTTNVATHDQLNAAVVREIDAL
jgi:2-succinyl-5-enolpyruvyl-6-hydroxy-3-cyclohexene-1-carboxylate synthase